MDQNVGTLDRVTRIVFGIILVAYASTGALTGDWVAQLLSAVGIIIGASLILSGALANCLVYKLLNTSACEV
ncbi:MAG: DUF2892 domain-containing protein [Rhodospirillaceae bacterium]|jgi:hypothetical protein|nr:DUF2892 domain-containing protein [Rhodospirillaceae bacterium]MBT5240144.1 DUF2892 domain-containing protein [Rhodospirillaceae bacterium]MBT5566923.1 DUF2892 domain-containing protein [Rhodospirillaceae bacterium]MBT6090390.1 DUF2892 domain-containing protein [Rhodospirillaceae bacterium]MBT7449299.1 DUF2892 domain-containing protein [Rhodospirillaceae bacterium]